MGFFQKQNGRFLLAGTLAVLFLCILLTQGREWLLLHARMNMLSKETFFNESFREMNISGENLDYIRETSEEQELPFGELLASVMIDEQYRLRIAKSRLGTIKELVRHYEEKTILNPKGLAMLGDAYEAVFADLVYFPVPRSNRNPQATVAYEDTWLSERSYGGERRHEGTDLMAAINKRGLYPVVSITDGVVEQAGWLEQGGYRIGIRSPHGGYFYYAHLASYAKQWQAGDEVHAGELLGMMGDTGYSAVEGTVGNFDVHLHLGIYIRTPAQEELSVNPYYILKYLESNTLTYQF